MFQQNRTLSSSQSYDTERLCETVVPQDRAFCSDRSHDAKTTRQERFTAIQVEYSGDQVNGNAPTSPLNVSNVRNEQNLIHEDTYKQTHGSIFVCGGNLISPVFDSSNHNEQICTESSHQEPILNSATQVYDTSRALGTNENFIVTDSHATSDRNTSSEACSDTSLGSTTKNQCGAASNDFQIAQSTSAQTQSFSITRSVEDSIFDPSINSGRCDMDSQIQNTTRHTVLSVRSRPSTNFFTDHSMGGCNVDRDIAVIPQFYENFSRRERCNISENYEHKVQYGSSRRQDQLGHKVRSLNRNIDCSSIPFFDHSDLGERDNFNNLDDSKSSTRLTVYTEEPQRRHKTRSTQKQDDSYIGSYDARCSIENTKRKTAFLSVSDQREDALKQINKRQQNVTSYTDQCYIADRGLLDNTKDFQSISDDSTGSRYQESNNNHPQNTLNGSQTSRAQEVFTIQNTQSILQTHLISINGDTSLEHEDVLQILTSQANSELSSFQTTSVDDRNRSDRYTETLYPSSTGSSERRTSFTLSSTTDVDGCFRQSNTNHSGGRTERDTNTTGEDTQIETLMERRNQRHIYDSIGVETQTASMERRNRNSLQRANRGYWRFSTNSNSDYLTRDSTIPVGNFATHLRYRNSTDHPEVYKWDECLSKHPFKCFRMARKAIGVTEFLFCITVGIILLIIKFGNKPQNY